MVYTSITSVASQEAIKSDMPEKWLQLDPGFKLYLSLNLMSVGTFLSWVLHRQFQL